MIGNLLTLLDLSGIVVTLWFEDTNKPNVDIERMSKTLTHKMFHTHKTPEEAGHSHVTY